jgi:hypothetical protein
MFHNLLKLFLSLIILVLTAYVLTPFFNLENQTTGTIMITIIDNNDQIKTEEIGFTEGESLFEVLNNRYTLECASVTYQPDATCSHTMMGSHILMSIDDLKTNWTNTYIEILVDGERSMYGIDLIELQDNMAITFQFQTIE